MYQNQNRAERMVQVVKDLTYRLMSQNDAPPEY